MSKARNISNLFSASTDVSTDAEVTSAISTHSSAADPHSVYLKESEYVAAGKNFIVNGGFDVWQRGTSFSLAQMTADRWFQFGNDTLTRQSFTATAPEVPNGLYYLRYQATQTGAYHYIETRIENGHNDLSGKTVTISFWGKSNTGSNNSFSILTALNNDSQLFSANFTLTTIWTKYFATFTLPIINFAATYRYLRMGGIGDGGGVDIAQVQYEIGSAPTHFSRAGGDLQGEIAKCQRYFVRYEKTSGNQTYFASGNVISTTRSMLSLPLPVNMRATPSISRTAGVAVYNNGSNYNLSSLAVYQSAQNILNLDASVSSGLTNNTSSMFSLTTNGDYLDFSAEL